MAAIVLQRYLLAANSALQTFPASGTGAAQVFSAIVPLGATWTIRLRSAFVSVAPQDNSGSLDVNSLTVQWALAQNGSNLFLLSTTNSIISPQWPMPKVNPANVAFYGGDADQTVSSVDIVGGFINQVQASAQVWINNTDAANPHSCIVGINAILEFLQPGSSE